ncbi:carboxypeptidase-like regulatory domain-containing protein [Caenimonas terrae]|uniref:Carboxypeptidase-like regulatory domain-containing protein n=1 Tax=Caenimonas terrae TaxID=696074 RepID=A0ABW0NHJ6_9BURK
MNALRADVVLSAKWLWLLAGALTSLSASGQQMLGGDGQVLDTTTQQPIEGATVAMECRRTLLGHGSAKVRDVTVTSDKDGMYQFSFLQVVGCDFAYVRVRKPGYQDSAEIHVGYAYTNYEKIPRYRYLTADADVVMLRLTAITPSRSGNVFHLDGSPAHAEEYRAWYEAFLQAKDIAQTERERQFVQERYCRNLPELYSMLNEKEKASMANYPFQYQWRGTFRRGRHDYAAEVQAYCGR